MAKLQMFGERVPAKVRGRNGEDRFEVGRWLGKTDRATNKGLRRTRTIRQLPTPFEGVCESVALEH